MTSTTEQCAAQQKAFTRTADNVALYTALAGAERVQKICEQLGSAEPGYRLIRIDDRLNMDAGSEFEIALLDDASASVAFYDKITLVRCPSNSSRHIARSQIWRSTDMRHSLALRDISQKVLFGYLIHHHDILLEEFMVSGAGKFYWHRQVSRAIDGGLHVYLYEAATQLLRPIPTQRALNEIEDAVWSEARQEPLRALISISPR